MKTAWRVCAAAVLAFAMWSSSALGQIPVGNHYLCHKTRDVKVPAKFVSQTGVPIVDQVGNFSCDVKKPFLLCNPAQKNGSPIVDANLHYCCYKVKCTPNKIPTQFDVTDQYGPLRLETGKAFHLCNPCSKVPAS